MGMATIIITRIVIQMVAVHPILRAAPAVLPGRAPNRKAFSERERVRDRFDRPRPENRVVKSVTCPATSTHPAKVHDSDRVRSRVSRRTIRGPAKSKSLVPFFGCRRILIFIITKFFTNQTAIGVTKSSLKQTLSIANTFRLTRVFIYPDTATKAVAPPTTNPNFPADPDDRTIHIANTGANDRDIVATNPDRTTKAAEPGVFRDTVNRRSDRRWSWLTRTISGMTCNGDRPS